MPVTYRDQHYRIETRPRRRINPEDSRLQRDLLHLPEQINANADHNDGSDVDAACPSLYGLENEEAYSRDDSCEPWN